MSKKYGVVQTLISVLVFFLVFAIVLESGSAEEKAVNSSKGIPKWRKVAVLEDSIADSDEKNWCGKSSIVYFYKIPHVTDQEPGYTVGGFKLYDVKTGKEHSIIKDIMTGRPFCNDDGSFVYWFGGKKIKEKEKSKNTTLLSGYDTKTGHIWQVSHSYKVILNNRYVLPYYLPSSTTNIMLTIGDNVVTEDQKWLADISKGRKNIYIIPSNDDKQGRLEDLLKKLPDWRMMQIPFTAELCDIGDWARDGGYFYLMTTDPNTGICRTAIYDANGRLKRYPDPPFEDEYRTVIIKGGYYVLDTKANLLIMTDIETGEKRIYPAPEGTLGFDISFKGEVVYWIKKEKGPNIYFANKIGDKPRLLEYRGGATRFSPDGKYLYFSAAGLVVLKRE